MTDQTDRLAEIRARVEAQIYGCSNCIYAKTQTYVAQMDGLPPGADMCDDHSDDIFLLDLVDSLTKERDEWKAGMRDALDLHSKALATVDELRAQLAQREGELEALRGKVRELLTGDAALPDSCPWCRDTKGETHLNECLVARLFAALSDNQEGQREPNSVMGTFDAFEHVRLTRSDQEGRDE